MSSHEIIHGDATAVRVIPEQLHVETPEVSPACVRRRCA
jgi:hypothetical protein